MTRWKSLAVVLLIPLLPAPSLAQDTKPSDPPAPPIWSVTLGAGTFSAPRFDGARNDRARALPSADIVWKDRVFLSTRDGAGVNIINDDGLKIGPIVRYNPGRKSSDDRDGLNGLDRVRGTAEAGGFVKFAPSPAFSASAELRQGIGGHKGLIAELAGDVSAPPLLGERLFLSAGPRLSLSNDRYNKSFYGVSTAEAARTTYARYVPGSGLRSVGIGAAAIYEVTPGLSAGLLADYYRLTGAAADSPIVKGPAGSPDQAVFGLILTYRVF